jgi:hypothetical protein
MILIDKIEFNNHNIFFYDGIDFDMIKDHKDTSGDFLIFFIYSWVDEVKKWRRDQKIKTILEDIDNNFDPDLINKNTISIYLTNGYVMETYKVIKDKIFKLNYEPLAWNLKGLV